MSDNPRDQLYYKWASDRHVRLKRSTDRPPGEFAHVRVDMYRKFYRIYGRYTSHDNYMGYHWCDNLAFLSKLLKAEEIPYKAIELEKFEADSERWLISAWIEIGEDSYKRLKKWMK